MPARISCWSLSLVIVFLPMCTGLRWCRLAHALKPLLKLHSWCAHDTTDACRLSWCCMSLADVTFHIHTCYDCAFMLGWCQILLADVSCKISTFPVRAFKNWLQPHAIGILHYEVCTTHVIGIQALAKTLCRLPTSIDWFLKAM